MSLYKSYRDGFTPTISRTLIAILLCRFHCSTAMATTSPPMKSMLESFRYWIQTLITNVTGVKLKWRSWVKEVGSLKKKTICSLHLEIPQRIPWCPSWGREWRAAGQSQPAGYTLCTSRAPWEWSRSHILSPVTTNNRHDVISVDQLFSCTWQLCECETVKLKHSRKSYSESIILICFL